MWGIYNTTFWVISPGRFVGCKTTRGAPGRKKHDRYAIVFFAVLRVRLRRANN
jgi:hypothetical protein